jgi:hypothetical protein
MGSAVLDLAIVVVAGLVRKLDDRPAGDGFALAAQRLPQLTAGSVRTLSSGSLV